MEKTPYGEKVDQAILEIINDSRLSSLTGEQLLIKRHRLNLLANKAGNKEKPYVYAAIFFLKKNLKIVHTQQKRHTHIMTDHAFCRYLERIEKLDVNHLKNLALGKLNKDSAIYYNGRIVTVLAGDQK